MLEFLCGQYSFKFLYCLLCPLHLFPYSTSVLWVPVNVCEFIFYTKFEHLRKRAYKQGK